jgi:hypothetical protein
MVIPHIGFSVHTARAPWSTIFRAAELGEWGGVGIYVWFMSREVENSLVCMVASDVWDIDRPVIASITAWLFIWNFERTK